MTGRTPNHCTEPALADVRNNDQLTEDEQKRIGELKKTPMQAEVKHLERRWNNRGVTDITEPKDDGPIEDKINWYQKFALCVTRCLGRNNVLEKTELHINSEHLKTLMRNVIKTYPGVSFQTKNVIIPYEPRCLYHYRKELKDAGEHFEKDSEAAHHHTVLMQYINEYFKDTTDESDNLREHGLISFGILWTLFKPEDLVFALRLGQPRVYRLKSYQYVSNGSGGMNFVLTVDYIDFDGNDFGGRNDVIKISTFDGAVPVTQLNAFPLHLHDQQHQITRLLIARGRHFESLAGQNFCEYSGIAIDFSGTTRKSRYMIDGRVMIDCKTHHRVKTDQAFAVQQSALPAKMRQKNNSKVTEDDLMQQDEHTYTKLDDDQCLRASAMVKGFSFTEKIFLDFFVSNLSNIEWNDGCFSDLVLPSAQKETVQALVAEHTKSAGSQGFSDIVKGKGRGLILVLHGPPGVGKTLTAECVAEFAHRPLYMVSSGDLGADPAHLDTRLSHILDLASTWKAVLLIDEADVFLERRSLHDLQRNSLVSIFLRTLEYYSGILFMTTNRVRTFDDAFKSRIHMPLKYEELPPASRKKIWKTFLARTEGVDVDVDEEGYEKLSAANLNGRAIKNVVKTAKSLAAYKGSKLDLAQLQQVVEIQTGFERDLETGTPKDVEGVERSGC